MPKTTISRANLPLSRLAVPMYLESLLRSTLSSADVFMLAFFSQSAVAAVGITGNFTFLLMLLYTVITAGSSVLISQYLGASRERDAGDAALGSFILATGFAIIISLGMAFGARAILSTYKLEPDVHKYALQYLMITGGGSVFMAFNIVQSMVLRSYGHAKAAMISNMIANVCNVIGNAIAIFGPFGIPKTGVVGVAISTVLSQAIACIILSIHIHRLKEIAIPWQDFKILPLSLYKKILSIGAPIAGENLSYNLSQIVISWIIASFGTAAISANTYATTLLRFVFMPAFSIGNAGQIKTGYLVGANRFTEAKKNVWRYFGIGFCITLVAMTILYAIHTPLLRVFTKDTTILSLSSVILLIGFARETGRVANIIIIPGLKGAGDVMFPVVIGIIVMWLVGAGGAWLFGLYLGWGLSGVWIAIAADEWVRSIFVGFRWESNKWQTKSFVKTSPVSRI